MPKKFDCSGYATKNDLLCSDGRVIKKDAFKDQDGTIVPLVWNHQHNNPDNVLGHALLENREDGVYAYCFFNETGAGDTARKIVKHGDVKSLSIWANKLKHAGANVVHGAIREVSLVLAGANPGAYIDSVLAHGEVCEDEAILYYGEELSLSHSEESEEETDDGLNSDEKAEEVEIKHSNEGEKEMPKNEKTVKDILNTMNEEQLNVLYGLVGSALEQGQKDSEEDDMKHNLFENEQDDTLVHADEELMAAVADGKKYGSLKDSFLAHGIDNIDYLFPEAKNLADKPGFINTTPIAWVDVIMNGVHHTPMSRIKMIFADITMESARAKGYVKGNYKVEEQFSLLRRKVGPTTVYKKQKLERDDIIDITDFDVVAWLKVEMRMKLDEELARAFIFGDGRVASDDDKIDENCIIPVIKDTTNNLYAMKYTVTPAAGESLGHALIKAHVKANDDYEGSGNTVTFIKQSLVSDLMLIEDTLGHRMYKTLDELAAAMLTNKIVKIPASVVPQDFLAVTLDLRDYNVGADKGGAVNMFDDFDIDYNAEKYLIETRCSGCLTLPHSAIVLVTAQD